MMALRVRELPVGNWLYEMKFDGYRALAFKNDKEVRLLSRNRTFFNVNYPVPAIRQTAAKSMSVNAIICLFLAAKSLRSLPDRYGASVANCSP
jgi:bifunctional non-homologous end joining protein LigD